MRAIPGDLLLFSSRHFIRVLASSRLDLEPTVNSKHFMLSTASLSALGHEENLSRPEIRRWNDTHHWQREFAEVPGFIAFAVGQTAF